ncbi:MAG: hypothetical protein NZZ41_04805 [Candidatus Dojkabacteria bacterium]|nr:hypothetical protein [Candidatus Dojkabacteria bacterium]
MSSKIITNKFNVYKTPFSKRILQKGEYLLATDSPYGLLFTKIKNGVEYIYDEEDIKQENDDYENYVPIHLSPYKEIQ